MPQLFALLARVPNPRVRRAPLAWGVLASYGAGYFTTAAVLIVFTLIARALTTSLDWVNALATLAGTAVALSVAYVAAGREAVIVYATLFVIVQSLSLAVRLRFCIGIVSDAPFCSVFAYVLGLWPEAVGAAIAYKLVGWFRVSEGDRNPLLEAAGGLALVQGLLSALLGLLLASAGQFESGVLVLAATLAGGIACGQVLLRRVAESARWRTLAYIAVAALGVWLFVSLPLFSSQIGIRGTIGFSGLGLIGFLAPVFEIGAAAMVLYLAAARQLSAREAVSDL
jgi:hypothetical protein